MYSMKDYNKLSSEKRKANDHFFIKCVFSIYKKIIKFLAILIVLVSVFLIFIFSFWLFFPQFKKHNGFGSYVYIFKCSDSEINKIYYALFEESSNKIRLFSVNSDYVFQWPNFKNQVMEEGTTIDYLGFINEEQMLLKEAKLFWMTNRLIDEVIIFDEEIQCHLLEEDSVVTQIKAEVKKHIISQISFSSIQKSTLELTTVFFADWILPVSFPESQLPPSTNSSECSVAVLNATNISGYAQKISSTLELTGYRVVRVDSIGEKTDQNSISVSNKNGCRQLSTEIGQKLFEKYKILDDEESESLISRYRADIVLVLGNSY